MSASDRVKAVVAEKQMDYVHCLGDGRLVLEGTFSADDLEALVAALREPVDRKGDE